MQDPVEAIYRILSARALSAGEQRLPLPPAKPVRVDQLAVGQQVQGKVLDIANGKATVLINNQQVRMELPFRAAAGDTFQLVFAGQHPRPTFVLAGSLKEGRDAVHNDAAQLPGRVLSMEASGEGMVLIGDRTLRMALPTGTQVGDSFRLVFTSLPPADASPAANVLTHISDAAHLLGEAMKMALDRKAPALAGSLGPLLGEPPGSTAALALALRLALARTGLFYESHLCEWSSGHYPLSSLLHEPQGRYSDPALLREHAQAWPEGPGGTAEFDLLQLIAQQLQLLENRSLVWRGEVWPRQTMEWEIARREQEDDKAADSELPSPLWKTRLSLDLPRLGRLVADISMDAEGRMAVRLEGGENALSRIEPRRGEAMRRLAAAGCQVSSFSVAQHGRA